MNTIFYITRKGDIRMAELIKPAFVIRPPGGRAIVSYRIYKSEAEAQQAITENGGKVIKKMEDTTTGTINSITDFQKELNLLKLKIAVLEKTKADRPWYQKLYNRITKKEN